MKKLLFVCMLMLVAGSAYAWPDDFNLRQRANLYVKAGQYWEAPEVKDIQDEAPELYWGVGLNLRLTMDNRFRGTLELKKAFSPANDYLPASKVDWSVSYHF